MKNFGKFNQKSKIYLLYSLIFVLIAFALQSCESITGEKTMEITSKNISEISNDSATALYKNMDVIPLERTTNSEINDVIKLVVYNNDYYILSRDCDNLPILFRFDKNGRFCNRIGNFGIAESDYNYISTFFLMNNKVYIIDGNDKKMLIYNCDGSFIDVMYENQNEYSFIHDAAPINNETILLTKNLNAWDQSLYQIYNLRENKIVKTIDTKFTVEGSIPYAMSEMTILKDSIYLLMPFEKYIYKLNSSDFSMNKLYEETALNMIPEIQSNSYYEVTNEIEKNHGDLILGIYMTSNYLLINYIKGSILYDKMKQHGYFVKNEIDRNNLKKIPFYGLFTKCVENDCFICVWSSEEFIDYYNKIYKDQNGSEMIVKQLEKEIPNPVILRYKF